MRKKALYGIAAYAITIFSCVLLLMMVNKIPQSRIQANAERTADYFREEALLPVLIDKTETTRMDNYADCIFMNVLYHVDSSAPLHSAIADPYYRNEEVIASDDLYESVYNGAKPQSEYSRYWHGMQIFVRPLLLGFSFSTIRYLLGALLIILNIWLFVALWRRQYRIPAVLYMVAFLLVDGWMCVTTLEYISVFLIMTASCLAMLYGAREHMPTLLLVGGTLTAFFDFLTAETLTFTIPVLLYFLLYYQDEKKCDHTSSLWERTKQVILWGVAWLIGYALTFLLKWILVYITCGTKAFWNAVSEAAYRIGGSVSVSSDIVIAKGQMLRQLLLKNLGCLLHVQGQGTATGIVGLFVLACVLLLSFLYLFHKKKTDNRLAWLFLLMGVLPFVRWLVLANHSYLHYFFTYRAGMALILAILGSLWITTDITQFRKKRIKGRRTSRK